jgi:glycosyltransferase involved in cell wall biosynthesis
MPVTQPTASDPGLVSVMVPAYNASRTLRDTLDSVAAQTHRPVELVLIDDGSTDSTDAVAREWIANNSLCGISV